MSDKLAKERKTYRDIRLEFLKEKKCAVYPNLPATEVHHTKGRGIYLNEISTWLPVSRKGHDWCEMNPEAAKARGFSVSRLN